MEEKADVPGIFGGTGRSKAANEFLVLHYFGLDSAKHWDALLSEVLPAVQLPGASARVLSLALSHFQVLVSRGDHMQSLGSGSAAELQEDVDTAICRLADVHAKRGKFREAEKLYKDVLEIAPTPATPRKQILRTRRGKATV
eukprot:symbB.v1.2.040494.t1/scaffold7279.1/size12137/1